MALIILMVFNAPIMAISLNQPNSSHSINETPGLLHSISTQRHTTFGGTPRSTLRHSYSATLGILHLVLLQTKGSHLTLGLLLLETIRLLLSTKCSHLTLGFLHYRSAKPVMPTATAAPQPPGYGNTFFRSIIIWTLLCIHMDLPILCVLT